MLSIAETNPDGSSAHQATAVDVCRQEEPWLLELWRRVLDLELWRATRRCWGLYENATSRMQGSARDLDWHLKCCSQHQIELGNSDVELSNLGNYIIQCIRSGVFDEQVFCH
jgi:hypothetical protein